MEVPKVNQDADEATELRLKIRQLEIELAAQKERDQFGPIQDKVIYKAFEFEELFNLSFDMLAIIGCDGHIRKINSAFEKTLGYSQSEVFATSIQNMIHPEDLSRLADEFSRFSISNSPLQFEYRHLHCEGSYKWLKSSVILDNAEKLIYAVLQEIPEVKQSEQDQLRFQGEVLAKLNDAVVVIDEAGKIIYLNKAAEELYHVEAKSVLGKPQEEVYSVEWVNTVEGFNLIETLEHTAYTRNEAIQKIKATGESIYTDSLVALTKDGNGSSNGIIEVSRNITELKKSEEIQQYLAKVSVTLASTLDYETTLKNVVKLTVPYLADWFSLDLNEGIIENNSVQRVATAHINLEKEALAHHMLEVYPYTSEQLDRLRAALLIGKTLFTPDIELESIARNPAHLQALRKMNLSSSMLVPLVARGQLLGALTLGITESKRKYTKADQNLAEELSRRVAMSIDNALLYRQAQNAIKRQMELDLLKDEFISIAGHELRSPLTTIKGYAQLLNRKLVQRQKKTGQKSYGPGKENISAASQLQFSQDSLNNKSEENISEHKVVPLKDEDFSRELLLIDSISKQSNRLNILIDEMLDITRVQSGQLELNYTSQQDFVQLVRELVQQQEEISENHPISLEVTEPEIIADFDTGRIEQVLLNLINNAGKYSPENSPITIKISLIDSSESLKAVVLSPTQSRSEVEEKPRVEDKRILVQVQDQGLGISKDQQLLIFERFYRISKDETRGTDGLGLGLYISSEIIRRHGGLLGVESEEGKGSTFYFTLPVKTIKEK